MPLRQTERDDDDDAPVSPREGLMEAAAPSSSSSCFEAVDSWIASSPNVVTYAVLLNSILLFILLIVCLVLYRRVQVTLDKVDAMADLNPFPH